MNNQKDNKSVSSAETFRFVDKAGDFHIVCKSEFLKIVNNPSEHNFAELLTQYNLGPLLHNPHGPAIFVPKNEHEEYWIDGKKCSKEVEAKIRHNIKFHDELESLLDSED